MTFNNLRGDVGRTGGEGKGEARVHLLTCSICLLFLPEWVSGGLFSDGFLTVINRDSFHPPAQFSEGQLTMKEKMEWQHLLRDSVQTTPVRQHSAQYQWHGPGENVKSVY